MQLVRQKATFIEAEFALVFTHMDTVLIVAFIIYCAVLTQTLAGSGLGLVAMPFLVGLLGPLNAAALTAMVAFTIQIIILIRYKRDLKFDGLWRLAAGMIVGIPLGIEALSRLDERLILTALGLLLVFYSLYNLFTPTMPEIKRHGWGFGFGFASGLLSGAYNTGGPPLVIYGMSRRWPNVEYKVNLQLLLLVSSSFVTFNHFLRGNYTGFVLENYLVALPMIALGATTGFYLDRFINAILFKRMVLVLLLIIGVRMLIG